MGNKLEVDTSALRDVSKKIEEFIKSVKTKQSKLREFGEELAIVWQGDDASKYQMNYKMIVEEDGWLNTLEENLVAFSNYLTHCAEKYEKAAERAINRANGIR